MAATPAARPRWACPRPSRCRSGSIRSFSSWTENRPSLRRSSCRRTASPSWRACPSHKSSQAVADAIGMGGMERPIDQTTTHAGAAHPAQDSADAGTSLERARAPATRQPFSYPLTRAYVEPDWRRIPGYRDVTAEQWESALWQRKNTIKNLKQLKDALGAKLSDQLALAIQQDQAERATMSLLVPPQMINTMNVDDLWNDPIRRYMLPANGDRRTDWPDHPHASRDSLHEADMWAVEGLTHRYPTKVLAETLPTCPQYCGHCTRMDLVGNSVPQVQKQKFETPPGE